MKRSRAAAELLAELEELEALRVRVWKLEAELERGRRNRRLVRELLANLVGAMTREEVLDALGTITDEHLEHLLQLAETDVAAPARP